MPDSCYESYETGELLAALDGLPLRLTILDINPRVLRIVRQIYQDVSIETVLVDLSESNPASLASLCEKFDLVVANAVVDRVKSRCRDTACSALRRLVRPGGILLGSGDFETNGFAKMSGLSSFYRKTLA